MKMFKVTHAVSASLLLLSASAATLAADNDNLTLTATVVPTACNVSVDEATINLPMITTSHLADTGVVAANDYAGFNAPGQTFTIECGSDASVGFTITDGAVTTDSAAPAGALGIGLGANATDGTVDQDIGYYTLAISNAQVDDVAVTGTFQSRVSSGDTYADESGDVMTGTTQYTYSDIIDTPAQKLSFTLTPKMYFWGKDKLDDAETHTIAGSYTVTAVF